MKRISTNIYLLRIWCEKTLTIRSRIFFKNQIVFGSDPKSDVQLANLSGLHSRLNFSSRELHYLDIDETKVVEPEDLFQIDSKIFQFKEFSWWTKPIRFGLATLLGGYLLLSLALSSKTIDEVPCPQRSKEILHSEEFLILKKSFEEAIRRREWVKARAEMNETQRILEKLNFNSQCNPQDFIQKMNLKLSEHLTLHYLQNSQVEQAAEELRRFSSLVHSHLEQLKFERLQKRIKIAASQIYLEGYALEDENLEKANELMDKASQICLSLRLDPECFKSKPSVSAKSLE